MTLYVVQAPFHGAAAINGVVVVEGARKGADVQLVNNH